VRMIVIIHAAIHLSKPFSPNSYPHYPKPIETNSRTIASPSRVGTSPELICMGGGGAWGGLHIEWCLMCASVFGIVPIYKGRVSICCSCE